MNAVSAFHHDDLFVPHDRADEALALFKTCRCCTRADLFSVGLAATKGIMQAETVGCGSRCEILKRGIITRVSPDNRLLPNSSDGSADPGRP